MLKLKNITYQVDGKKILKDISLDIDDKFLVITGPNGSGKSTLAKIIAGVIKPTSGQVLLKGEDITNLDITARANKGIAYAFQQPVKFKGITVAELLDIASQKKENKAELCARLSEVGMCANDYINREVNSSLSGGELKRIELATVIAREGMVTVFDEPEAGIDLWSFNSLIKVFERLQKKSKGSLVIISHQERILQIADKVVVLKLGKVASVAKPADILPNIEGLTGACPVIEGRKL